MIPPGEMLPAVNSGKHFTELRPPMIDGVTGNVWGDQDCYVFVKSLKPLSVFLHLTEAV
jgi:hypothetical protein